jgi:hypothetical protein
LVTDINGCTGTADVFVELDANRNVYIPNVFSPNGDGPNDEFRIFACTGVTSINSVKVFDRWGGLVYEADSLLAGLRRWPAPLGWQKKWAVNESGRLCLSHRNRVLRQGEAALSRRCDLAPVILF